MATVYLKTFPLLRGRFPLPSDKLCRSQRESGLALVSPQLGPLPSQRESGLALVSPQLGPLPSTGGAWQPKEEDLLKLIPSASPMGPEEKLRPKLPNRGAPVSMWFLNP